MDLFSEYLKNGSGYWHRRALTDESMMSRTLPESDTNATLATYGDALLKFTLCQLLLDQVEELTIEKAKYESDVSLVKLAKHYDLLDYLIFDRGNPHIPKDYHVLPIEHSFSHSKKERVRRMNRRRKYIATAMEALLGAMYLDHGDLSEIRTVVTEWMRILQK